MKKDVSQCYSVVKIRKKKGRKEKEKLNLCSTFFRGLLWQRKNPRKLRI